MGLVGAHLPGRPPAGPSRSHSGPTAAAGPTIVAHRRGIEAARSANTASASGVALTGTRLAAAWHAETSSPSTS